MSGLNQLESQYCYIGLGISLAAHTDNDLDKSIQYCSIAVSKMQELCKLGVKREIFEAKQNDVYFAPDSEREILYSFPVTSIETYTIDIVSSAQISDFKYYDKSFDFKTDTISPITIYMSRELLPDYGIFTVNDVIQTDVQTQPGLTNNHVMIKLSPTEYGLVSMN